MRVTVYAGSAGGHRPEYRQLAAQFGRDLAEAGAAIVYGGGRVGLLGAVADGALAADGTVVGVIPETLHDAELAHGGVTELHVVLDMHSRKQLMAGLGDCLIALPGSVGTSRRSSRSGLSSSSACTASRSCSSITAATGTSSAGSSTTVTASGFLRPQERLSLLTIRCAATSSPHGHVGATATPVGVA